MKIDAQFFHSPLGQLVVVAAVLLIGVLVLRRQHHGEPPIAASVASIPALLPKTFTRETTRYPQNTSASAAGYGAIKAQTATATRPPKPPVLPLTLCTGPTLQPSVDRHVGAPYGRIISCETIVTLESNRLETPVIGLVTEDVWHDGDLIIPAGAEVHGRASLDRTRERLAVEGTWHIVWRTPNPDNGSELKVQGLALDREFDAARGQWGDHDGSAGLRGQIIRTDNERDLKLFAATFLSTATEALQDSRTTAGLLGQAAIPAATARNATLAGTAAILREYAQSMREAIARDGFYLRIPAGKQFYLYVTQNIERGARRASGAPKEQP